VTTELVEELWKASARVTDVLPLQMKELLEEAANRLEFLETKREMQLLYP